MGNVLMQRYVPIAIRRGKGPLTNAAVARMISKLEATGCLDDRPRSVRPSTRRNAAETVKDEMETAAGSSMHGGSQRPCSRTSHRHSIHYCLVDT
ncbi:RNA-directed DNA polymerase from mobile element jockey [Trichonephila clavipes]|nr:RNA-directed DNA polymerase from mobile element jockey [Trichonephila clavipes]